MHEPSNADRGGGAVAPERARTRVWYLLLVVPMIGTLIPPIYNTEGPDVDRDSVLLLVPDALGAGHRGVHGGRLPLHEGGSVMNGVNGVELAVFIALFGFVSVLGFLAARWRRAETLASLDEWGLGGRNFGPWISWFLIGGDLYTAYTFVAVPALVFGAGAIGFFAVPYTIVVYPLVFLAALRLWSVSHRHGYVTPADFVRGRHGSRSLALAIALTGIVATMPYIALQLVGIQAVLEVIGIKGHWPLIIAFAVLAAYTYQSGLRAPALIAFIKDGLIYLVVLVAVIYIPIKLHGFDDIFAAADKKFAGSPAPGGRHAAEQRPGPRLLDAGARLGARPLHLPPFGDGAPGVAQSRHHQAHADRAARLHPAPRPARPPGLHGDRGRGEADHRR